jgi:hypothetical protein
MAFKRSNLVLVEDTIPVKFMGTRINAMMQRFGSGERYNVAQFTTAEQFRMYAFDEQIVRRDLWVYIVTDGMSDLWNVNFYNVLKELGEKQTVVIVNVLPEHLCLWRRTKIGRFTKVRFTNTVNGVILNTVHNAGLEFEPLNTPVSQLNRETGLKLPMVHVDALEDVFTTPEYGYVIPLATYEHDLATRTRKVVPLESHDMSVSEEIADSDIWKKFAQLNLSKDLTKLLCSLVLLQNEYGLTNAKGEQVFEYHAYFFQLLMGANARDLFLELLLFGLIRCHNISSDGEQTYSLLPSVYKEMNGYIPGSLTELFNSVLAQVQVHEQVLAMLQERGLMYWDGQKWNSDDPEISERVAVVNASLTM